MGGLKFNSERFNKINKDWYTWGSFEFQMNREQNRNWSNVFNTFNDSPYIFGDSVKGNYDKQFFDLNAKISRKFSDRFGIGVALDYYAGDMSRIRDPRTRTFLVNYAASPALIFALSEKQHIGISGGIRYEKEKMPSIITIQTDPKIDYYFFLGNENTYSVLDGYKGFDRQYVTLGYQFELQHNLMGKAFSWFNSFAYLKRNQQIFGSERESPGSFSSMNFVLNSKFTYTFDNKLAKLQLVANHKTGQADEFLQERVEVRDTLTGVVSREWKTLFSYKNRYITESYNLHLNGDIRDLINSDRDYNWLGGFNAQLNGFRNRYYLPYSCFESQIMNIGLYGSYRIFNKNNHSIRVKLSYDYGFSLLNNVQLNTNSKDNPKHIVY